MTQRDVARSLGVTQATVSLALRNDPRIPEKRRREIQIAAEALGYQPSAAASTLAQMRHSAMHKPLQATLAWVNCWENPQALRDHRELWSYFEGAAEACLKFGYRIEEFRCSSGLHPQRLQDILVNRGIEGILLPPHNEDPNWGGFDWNRFSIIKFGRSLIEPRSHMVSSNQLTNAMLGFQSMRDRGFKRIGYVGGKVRHWLFDAGFLKAQSALPKSERIPLLRLPRSEPAKHIGELSAWLREHRPDAILTDVNVLSSMLQDLKFRVPEDIAVATTTILDGNLTAGIDQHPREIGRVGVLSLLSLIHDHDRGIPALSREILIQGSWRDGASLPSRV